MSDDKKCKIGPGCEVVMNFSISFPDGEIVESTFEVNEPLRFSVGDGLLGSGLETAIFGLQAGDKQTLEIEAGIAFGNVDPGNVHTMPGKDFLNKGIEVKPGLVMDFTVPNGDSLLGSILEVTEDSVTVDFNHPLAARDIIFTVAIVSVEFMPG